MNKEIPRNEILVGDAKEKLSELPDNSVDTAMTSPPYWRLRDYGEEGQLGLEPKPEKYVENLMEVFNELQRVLKPTGTFYLNIDDTYYSGKGKSGHATDTAERNEKGETINEGHQTPDGLDTIPSNNRDVDLPNKSMSMIPERVMMAMVDSGWILRNKIVWRKKGGGMPESVKDRFSTTWEHVYMFSLNQDYYFDLDAVREPHSESSKKRLSQNNGNPSFNPKTKERNLEGEENLNIEDLCHPSGKNPGDMWTISTAQMSEAHFAVYPEELCERPVKASCPKKVCSECGQPYVKKEKKKGVDQKPEDFVITERSGKHAKADKEKAHSVGNREKYWSEQRKHIVNQKEFARFLKPKARENDETLDELFGRDKWEHWIRTDNSGSCLPPPEKAEELAKVVDLGSWEKKLRETHYVPVDDSKADYKSKWIKPCGCETEETEKGIVLDPFAGAGTTCLVARQHNRGYIGLELNEEYAEMARERIKEQVGGQPLDKFLKPKQSSLDSAN